jgi:two-component system sensor histidine kinase/response regulator
VRPPAAGLSVRSDRRGLSQILINLANNAIKFTDRGSVRLEAVSGTTDGLSVTRFSVIDTGRGIKAADQERLFAAFEQIKSTTSQPYEGTGLGLYISQTLADRIGASITFASEFGHGSSFVLELAE